MLFGPLIPFALVNQKATPYEIDSGEIKVYVSDKRGIKLGTMFHSNINYMVSNMTVSHQVHDKLNKKEMLFYKIEQFKQLNLSTRSETYQNLQDKFFVYRHSNDRDNIIKELMGGGITFELNVGVRNSKLYIFLIFPKFQNFHKIAKIRDIHLIFRSKTRI